MEGGKVKYKNQLANKPIHSSGVGKLTDKKWDAFICHASEDKTAVAQPLAERLQNHGCKIWYDDITLKIGDSLSRSINHGLANSQYGIVIISHNFFSKDWPQKELEGLVARENHGKKIILPVWHKITHEEVVGYCPILADKLATDTKDGLDSVASRIINVIKDLPDFGGDTSDRRRPYSQHIRSLREGNDRERNEAAHRLREFDDPQVVDALLDSVKHDWKVRYEALLSLYELRSKKARDSFIERLEDPSPRIRHISILALGEIGDATEIEFLQKIVDTNDFSFLNTRRDGGKGQRKNWGQSQNVLVAKRAIESIQKRNET